MSLDDLELQVRKLEGVVAVGFADEVDALVVEVQVGPDASPDLPREVSRLVAAELPERAAAVEVVRWGDGEPREAERRLRLLGVVADPSAGHVTVRLARDDEEAAGRASTDSGLVSAVEATVYAVRTFVPDLPYLPGWARTVETTPERRFLVVASVTDPLARAHRRGTAEGSTPIEAAARATLAALNRTISRDL